LEIIFGFYYWRGSNMKNGLWIWATVAAMGLGTTAAAASSSLNSSSRVGQQTTAKRSHVTHARQASQAKPMSKHSATPTAKSTVKKSAKPMAKKATSKSHKSLAKKPTVGHSSHKQATSGRLAKRHV
jgi:hypothetical protein